MTSPYTAVNEVRTTLRDDLIAAKALIDTPEKWGRKRFRDALTGKSCIRGACAIATGTHFLSLRAGVLEDALCVHLPRRNGERGRHALARFNDDDETAHADVMALFDRAIASAESSS